MISVHAAVEKNTRTATAKKPRFKFLNIVNRFSNKTETVFYLWYLTNDKPKQISSGNKILVLNCYF